MSRVLRFVLIDFQAFPNIPGNSTQHERDTQSLHWLRILRGHK
jgi:hypothetical protein